MELIQPTHEQVRVQIEYWCAQVAFAEKALDYATEQLEIWSDK